MSNAIDRQRQQHRRCRILQQYNNQCRPEGAGNRQKNAKTRLTSASRFEKHGAKGLPLSTAKSVFWGDSRLASNSESAICLFERLHCSCFVAVMAGVVRAFLLTVESPCISNVKYYVPRALSHRPRRMGTYNALEGSEMRAGVLEYVVAFHITVLYSLCGVDRQKPKHHRTVNERSRSRCILQYTARLLG